MSAQLAPPGPFWAVVEIQGRQAHHGLVREVTLAGRMLLQIDVFLPSGDTPFLQPMVEPGMLYRVTPVTEETARRLAAQAVRFADPHVALALPATVGVPAPNPSLIPEQWEALNNAVGELCHVDANLRTERIPAAERLSRAFGLRWPPFDDGLPDEQA